MFAKVYKLASKAKDVIDLRKQLATLHIDAIERKPPYLTAAGRLAKENNLEAVELLRQLETNIDSIACGFAMAGNDDMVSKYQQEYKANIDAIVMGYAFAGNHKKVEEYRTKYKININKIVSAYAMAGNIPKAYEYLLQENSNLDSAGMGYTLGNFSFADLYVTKENISSLAQCAAIAGNTDRVREYRLKGADVTAIAQGYALVGDHDMVEKYRIKYNANVNHIVFCYALIGNHEKVEEYRIKYGASVDNIAFSYALVGNHKKVEHYRTEHKANVNSIASAYARAGFHLLVEEYRKNHHADVQEIAAAYTLTNHIPPFYHAITRLLKHKEEGLSVIKAMTRLKEGQEKHQWCPYWMNVGGKLDDIIKAVSSLKENDKILDLVNDNNSELYKALNKRRLTQVSILSCFGGKTKSTSEVENSCKLIEAGK